MILTVPPTTENYLRVMNGFLSISKTGGLTETEIKILALFFDTHKELESKTGHTLNPFCIAVKKAVATSLGKTSPHALNNVIKSLKDKKAIRKHPDGSGYRIHAILQPQDRLGFTFRASDT